MNFPPFLRCRVEVRVEVVVACGRIALRSGKLGVVLVHEAGGRGFKGAGRGQREQLHVVRGGVALVLILTESEKTNSKRLLYWNNFTRKNVATPVDALVAEMGGRGLGAFRALPIHTLLHLG